MKTDLKDYIKIFPKVIPEVIQQQSLVALTTDSASWEKNYFYNPTSGGHDTRSGENELDMSFQMIPTSPELMQCIGTAIYSYITELKFPWFTSWQGYSRIRFNKYNPTKEMALHYDAIHEIFDGNIKGIPTLSIIGLLNDEYTGGELIMFDDYKIELEAGDVVVFPSTFLYPHKVTPVITGNRYAFVSWAW